MENTENFEHPMLDDFDEDSLLQEALQQQEVEPPEAFTNAIPDGEPILTEDVRMQKNEKLVTLSNIHEVYEKTFGVKMTDDQVQNLLRMCNTLNIKDDDGILTILLVFENYYRLYLQAPWEILNCTRSAIKEIEIVAQKTAKEEAYKSKRELESLAAKAAGHKGIRRYMPWLIPLLASFVMYFIGYYNGQFDPVKPLSMEIYYTINGEFTTEEAEYYNTWHEYLRSK